MKKILTVLVLVLIAGLCFAKGQDESKKLVLLVSGEAEELDNAVSSFSAEFPDVEVEVKVVDLSDGSTLTMDAMLAAGTPPNVYTDYMGRVSKYIDPVIALDLGQYHDDLDDYKPGTLLPVMRAGKVLGLPQPGGVQGMAVNLDLLERIGITEIPEDWTIKQFMVAAAKVKALDDDKYVTGMFAANQSGDYLYMNWLSSFGANVYEGGYDKTAINTVAGLKVFKFWKMLYDNGYIEKESPILSDDDYAASWAKGKYLVTGFFPAWAPIYFDSAIEQGVIEKPHRYAFVSFPRTEGVDRIPAATSFPGIVVIKDEDEEINKLAARLAWYLNNKEYQETHVRRNQTYTNRKSVTVEIDDPYWRQINEIVDKNGTLDLGLTTQTFSAVRTQMFPRLQDLWNGKQTPEEALEAYEAGVNKILRGE